MGMGPGRTVRACDLCFLPMCLSEAAFRAIVSARQAAGRQFVDFLFDPLHSPVLILNLPSVMIMMRSSNIFSLYVIFDKAAAKRLASSSGLLPCCASSLPARTLPALASAIPATKAMPRANGEPVPSSKKSWPIVYSSAGALSATSMKPNSVSPSAADAAAQDVHGRREHLPARLRVCRFCGLVGGHIAVL